MHDDPAVNRPQPPQATATGDERVDEALQRLDGVHALPVREQVAVFETAHAALQDRLADVED